MSPVASLPPEILIQIFLWLHRIHLRPSDVVQRFQKQIAFSQVCRTWRAIAIDCPSLWTTVPTHNIDWTKLAIQRSKSITLTICITGRSHRESIFYCLRFLPSTSIFHISSLTPALWDSIRDLLSVSTAPHIEELNFSMGLVPDNVFKGNPCPRLSTLVLKSCDVAPDSCIFVPGITNLYISSPFQPGWTEMPLLLDTLRRMPNLEKLTLDGFANATAAPVAGTQDIVLPNLQEFVFSGSVDVLEPILRHLHAPIRHLVQIFLFPSQSIWLVDDQDDSTAGSWLNILMNKAFDNTTIREWSYNTASFTFFYSEIPMFTLDCEGAKQVETSGVTDAPFPRRFHLTILTDRTSIVHETLMTDICRRLPLDRAENMSLSGPPLSGSFDDEILAPLGIRAQTLTVEKEAAVLALGPLPAALHDGVDALPVPQGIPVLPRFPRIHTLNMSLVDFMENAGTETALFNRLLSAYASTQTPKRRNLVLDRCTLSDSMKMQLRDRLGEECVKFTEGSTLPRGPRALDCGCFRSDF